MLEDPNAGVSTAESLGDAATAPPGPRVPDAALPAPSGLICLAVIAGQLQRAVDPVQLARALGVDPGQPLGDVQLLRAARELGLRAKSARIAAGRLSRLALPVIVARVDGEYAVLLRCDADSVVVGDPFQPRPQRLGREEFEQTFAGRVILVKARLALDHPNRPFGLSWFVPALWKYRSILGEILAASFVIQLFALATPLFTQVVIDKVLMHKSASTLHVLASGMLILILFEAILTVLRAHLLAHTSNRIDVALGARLFRHLLHLPLRYFEQRRVGDTVARVRELESIRQFITGSTINVVLDVLFTVVFIAVMLLYSGVLTCVALACIPAFIALSVIVRPLMRARLTDKFDRGAENQAYLVESVTGVQTVKAMALEPVFNRRWEEQLARYATAAFRTSHLSGVSGALGQVLQKLSTLSILWVGAYLVMQDRLTVGQLIAFQMLAARVTSPILRVVQLWQDFQQVGLSVDRLGDLLNTRAEPTLSPGKASLPALHGAIRMENVRFRYAFDGPEILRNLTFEVPAGATVGVVGRSGSGKSTLAKLLQRLYIPESGRILIDGIDLLQADPMWLRRQIGVVLQENFLFSGTVRDNIAIHFPGAGMERIVEAARLAGAHEFVLELPEGYDTPVGERGTALSGGQRQRIAIARALIANPRILILDEATSALDYESERIIQENLGRICKGRTVFIIAHRLSTIRHADTILVMDRGQLAERGSHGELMARPGLYHYLFSQQLTGAAHVA
ncbi:MAG TPA: type I secretion system permease/ATPase [Steroidobacteraceae bacterium]|nr:type I secretion system permease/ATPase [Steroidobacteraceae bacterium]